MRLHITGCNRNQKHKQASHGRRHKCSVLQSPKSSITNIPLPACAHPRTHHLPSWATVARKVTAPASYNSCEMDKNETEHAQAVRVLIFFKMKAFRLCPFNKVQIHIFCIFFVLLCKEFVFIFHNDRGFSCSSVCYHGKAADALGVYPQLNR